jgi:site-specific recombinase XerD
MSPLLANSLKRFFSHYLPVRKGLAENTVLSYRDAIKLLLCYASDTRKKSVEELSMEDLDESLVLAFLDHVETVRGCSLRTRNARLAAIRAFFGFLAREEPSLLLHCQAIRAIPLKRTEHKMIGYLEEKEIQAMLDAVDVNSRMGIRDKALLLLFYNTGVRVSEIVGLNVTGLRLDESPQVRLLGKGKKYRSCPLWPETAQALQAYLQERAPKRPDHQQLFLNANGSGITRFGVRYIIRKYAAKAENTCTSLTSKSVSPHTIRHTTAMHLLRAGNEVNMVSYWLGHADINTTHVYLEIDMDMKRKMLQKARAPAINNALPWRKPSILQWLSNLAKTPQLCAAKNQPNIENQSPPREDPSPRHIIRSFT